MVVETIVWLESGSELTCDASRCPHAVRGLRALSARCRLPPLHTPSGSGGVHVHVCGQASPTPWQPGASLSVWASGRRHCQSATHDRINPNPRKAASAYAPGADKAPGQLRRFTWPPCCWPPHHTPGERSARLATKTRRLWAQRARRRDVARDDRRRALRVTQHSAALVAAVLRTALARAKTEATAHLRVCAPYCHQCQTVTRSNSSRCWRHNP